MLVRLGVAVCALALTGCTAPAGRPEQTGGSEAPKRGNAVTVALTDVSLGKVPYIVAIEERLFEKHGVEVDAYITAGAARTIADSGATANPAFVRGGDTLPDISTGGGSPMIIGVTTNVRDRGRVILATTDNKFRWWVFANPQITRLEELKGKRLGVSGYGTCTGFVARLIAQRMGWNPEQDLSILYGALGVRWLQEGTVDAIVADVTHYAYATSIGLKPLISLQNWNEPIPCDSVVVKRAWLEEGGNREKATRFLKALVEAIALVKKDPAAFNRAVAKWYNITDPQRQQLLYDGVKDLPAKPFPPLAGIKKVMELYNYHEMRRYKPEDFYDDSLLREIDRSGFIDNLYK